MSAELGRAVRDLGAGDIALIRIDVLGLSTEPMDMRAGAERLLARVVQVFGEARAHHGYLFTNDSATMPDARDRNVVQ